MRDGVFQTEGGLWGGCVNGKRIRVLSRTKAAAIYEVRQARLQLGAKPYIGENPMTNGTMLLIGAAALGIAGLAIYFLTKKPAAVTSVTTASRPNIPVIPPAPTVRTTALSPVPTRTPAQRPGLFRVPTAGTGGQTYSFQLTLPGAYDLNSVKAALEAAGFGSPQLNCSQWTPPMIQIIDQSGGFDRTVMIPDPTAVNNSLSQSCAGTFVWLGQTGAPFPTSLPGIPSIVVS